MTSERWQKLQEIFGEAIAVPAANREVWLESACEGDAPLLQDVRALLAADDERSGVPLNDPVHHVLLSLNAHHAPTRIEPYEMLEEIGRGGMGAVYKARRAGDRDDAIVAVKLIRPEMSSGFTEQRFRQESQILARLTHPSIARLLDSGTTDDGILYIVMEYIDGVGIAEHCEIKRLDLRERLELFLPVCAAVDYAHHHWFGEYCCVVHLDIKPGNILIDPSGVPKLLDFGISELLHVDDRERQPALIQVLTPHYASPEQARGEAIITTRSDVYSLGAVLYELLSGVRPRQPGMTDIPLPSAVAADPRVARRLSGDLDDIVMRAIHKDPPQRFESAAALAGDIRRYLDL